MIGKIVRWFKRHRKITLASILIIFVAALITSNKLNKSIKVDAAAAQKRTLTKYVNASGETEVASESTIYAQITANVRKINFENGSQIKKGELVLELDKETMLASLNTSWAAHLKAKAAYDTYFSDYEYTKSNIRAKKEIRDNAQEEYNGDKSDANKEALKTAEANFQSAQADQRELSNNKGNLEKLVQSTYSDYLVASKNYSNSLIKSPSDGTLILYDINEGQQVLNGQKLFSVVNKTSLVFKTEVDETDVVFVNPGQEATLKLDSYENEEIKGTVTTVEARTVATDSGSTAVKAAIQIEKENMALIEGLNGEAKIKVMVRENVLSIPFEYLQEDDKGQFVFVRNNGKAGKKYIMTALEAEDFIEITEGLSDGDSIIKAENLKEGDKIK